MSSLQTAAPALVGQVQYGRPYRRRTAASTLQCLVLSAAKSRRNMLSAAAAEAGWETVICADVSRALAAFRRKSFQLALIDLDSEDQSATEPREFCQVLASEAPQLLVSVCGQEDSPEEEIWARQLGCWLYLPGVTNSVELSLLCEQARKAVDRQHQLHHTNV